MQRANYILWLFVRPAKPKNATGHPTIMMYNYCPVENRKSVAKLTFKVYKQPKVLMDKQRLQTGCPLSM